MQVQPCRGPADDSPHTPSNTSTRRPQRPHLHEWFEELAESLGLAARTALAESGRDGPLSEQHRWEYRNREETWSVLVTGGSVILQTTAYTRFDSPSSCSRPATRR